LDVKVDNTDVVQDQAAASDTPSVETPTPSAEETQAPATFTAEQVATMMNERHSTLDKQVAERQKWLNLASMKIGELTEDKNKLQSSQVSDAALSAVDGGVDIARLRAELKEKELALKAQTDSQNWEWLGRQEVIEAAEKTAKDHAMLTIAAEFKVPLKSLQELTGDSIEQVRANAKVLAQLQPPAEQLPVDSGLNAGGATSNWEEIKALYAAGKLSHEEFAKHRDQPH